MGGIKHPGVGEKEVVGQDEVIPKSVRQSIEISNAPSNQITHVTTGPELGPANEERLGKLLHTRTVKLEQRSKFLKRLGQIGVGTNRIESNQLKSRKEMVVDSGRQVQKIKDEIQTKFKDAEKAAIEARRERNSFRNRIESEGVISKNTVKKMVARLQAGAGKLRKEISEKNRDNIEFKVKKWVVKGKNEDDLRYQSDRELEGYHELSVFNGEFNDTPIEEVGNVNA